MSANKKPKRNRNEGKKNKIKNLPKIGHCIYAHLIFSGCLARIYPRFTLSLIPRYYNIYTRSYTYISDLFGHLDAIENIKIRILPLHVRRKLFYQMRSQTDIFERILRFSSAAITPINYYYNKWQITTRHFINTFRYINIIYFTQANTIVC